jgi:antitoxin CcdA
MFLCAYHAHSEECAMKVPSRPQARTNAITESSPESAKRPVNLTLNAGVVVQARALTDNLSQLVDTLLADFVEQQLQEARAKSHVVEATVALWNRFDAQHGAFADEYSTL